MPATITGSQSGTVGLINALTAQTTVSGTAVDFTGIPSGVKRITVNFAGVSTSGASPVIVQLGAGSFQTTGYSSYALYSGGTVSATNGLVTVGVAGADVRWGSMVISNAGGNNWSDVVGNAVGSNGGAGGGGVSLSGTLDRVRITTVNGTDTFDAGSVNVLYE